MSQKTVSFVIQIIYLLLALNVSSSTSDNPIVETSVGTIRGLQATDGDYKMFLGIPFGKVNETNPFGVSHPYPNFEEVFDAYVDSPSCPQISPFENTAIGTLDCLQINVFVPNKASATEPLPVLVWIHGGQFSIGSAGKSLYGPRYLVRHDVVYVTLNYRLGPYGFMCLDTPEVPGNQGFKDQLLALRWIKNNIGYFGGNSEDITVFGNSAGSMAIDFHLLSPSEKLFNKAILQSGNAIRSNLFRNANRQQPINIARQLGFTTEDFEEALQFLARTDPISVINATFLVTTIADHRPCIETTFPSVERFITNFPINLEMVKANGMTILLGFNEHENLMAHYFRDYFGDDEFRNRLELAFEFGEEQLSRVSHLVRRFYIGDDDKDENVKWELEAFDSDVSYNYPADRSIERYLENRAEDVYYYVFSYHGNRNMVQRRRNVSLGTAVHADEVGYLFSIEFMPEVPTPEDQLVIDRMTTMWTNFAKFGNPTPDTTELLPVKWEPIRNGSVYYFLDINTELTLGRRPYHHRFAFWDLFYKAHAEYERGYDRSSATSSLLSPMLGLSILLLFSYWFKY